MRYANVYKAGYISNKFKNGEDKEVVFKSDYDKLKSGYDKLKADYDKLKENHDKLLKCVEFYGDEKNWKLSSVPPKTMYESEYLFLVDGEVKILGTRSKSIVGGKLARQTLKEVKGE